MQLVERSTLVPLVSGFDVWNISVSGGFRRGSKIGDFRLGACFRPVVGVEVPWPISVTFLLITSSQKDDIVPSQSIDQR